MITFTLSPTSWLGSCRGEGLICQTFSELASVASQWKKRPVGKVSSPFKGLCDETTAEERQICRDMANIREQEQNKLEKSLECGIMEK